jgi:hypothetical protein|tara:strand:- start:2706 stop:2900 length:195 start_codon:yes stop_codon:yes gene_type:complete
MDNLNQTDFEKVINLLILYKQLSPTNDVYLNEKSVKEAITFMSKNIPKDVIEQNKDLLNNINNI